MKIYKLHGEKVSIDSLREKAKEVIGQAGGYIPDDEVVVTLRQSGLNVEVTSVDGGLFSALAWIRP